ncbi:hypothetical protein KKC44_03640 [Patescibacteria group bacterium]|nr:hypothetical protein [Patescibacteria group bacterium]MBU2259677.1 hypothetical protein [Patescibacteria group bacterium]
MEQPQIFVINDPDIAVALELSYEMDQPFEHLQRHQDWLKVRERGGIFIVNTAGRNAAQKLNPIVCIEEYRSLVRDALMRDEPPVPLEYNAIWQPATWFDCDVDNPSLTEEEIFKRTSFVHRLHDCIQNYRDRWSNRVSRIIPGVEKLPKAINIAMRFRSRVEGLARKKGEHIAFSFVLDEYLRHGDLKKLTKKPKS